jgi:hypothetical protein
MNIRFSLTIFPHGNHNSAIAPYLGISVTKNKSFVLADILAKARTVHFPSRNGERSQYTVCSNCYIYTSLRINAFAPRPVKCRSEMKPLTCYGGCDNVLLGQGYRTPRGAVTGAYGGGDVVMVSGRKLKKSVKKSVPVSFIPPRMPLILTSCLGQCGTVVWSGTCTCAKENVSTEEGQDSGKLDWVGAA